MREKNLTKSIVSIFRRVKLLLINNKRIQRAGFYVLGFFSLVWVLMRIIPKPSRVSYPCVQAAAPFATGFILYIAGILTSVYAYRRALANFHTGNYLTFAGFLIISVFTFTFTMLQDNSESYANRATLEFDPNKPMGEPYGIISGRVTWAFDADATNHSADSDEWLVNTDLNAVENMVNKSILSLTGRTSLKESWDDLFKYFNNKHGKGDLSYQEGEKIYIKTNFMGTSWSIDQNYNLTKNVGQVRTSPEVVLVILRHLVNEMNISQDNISVGDPIACVANPWYGLWNSEFPDVNYIDQIGENGRTKVVIGTGEDIHYSDRGAVLRTGGPGWSDPSDGGDSVFTDSYYTVIQEADYMINIACLKGHHRAGIKKKKKNHFGSHTRERALHLHMGLVIPDGQDGAPTRPGYGKYRVQVDLMGGKYLGGNTMLFIVDGLYGGPDAGDDPVKFQMPPFNNDWSSSIFMSQDQVALESVCFDFLRTEFQEGNGHNKLHPQIDGVDDYLRQAADPAAWPENFVYDPDNSGEPLPSLGGHEHWNNSVDKLYSKNLGEDTGIDLHQVELTPTLIIHESNQLVDNFTLSQNYPNPFNPTTQIEYSLADNGHVNLSVYNITGEHLITLVDNYQVEGKHSVSFKPEKLSSGVYLYKLSFGKSSIIKKMLFQK